MLCDCERLRAAVRGWLCPIRAQVLVTRPALVLKMNRPQAAWWRPRYVA
jgi:hypothetical protein